MSDSAHSTRVLIVDDEPQQVRALSCALSTDALSATGVGTAAEALVILHSAARSGLMFDILVTDLNLPNMDGIELLRQAQLIDPDLVAVIMTGAGSIPTAVEAMKSGALDYILKPFSVAAIRTALLRALAVRRLRIQNTALLQRLQERTRELEVSNRDLRSANRELNTLAQILSAELRDPLNAILEALSQALAEPPRALDANLTSRLQDVMDSCHRMIDSLDALWHLSELSARPLAQEWLDVRALVGDVLRELHEKHTGIPVHISVTGLPEATADPSLLKMIFAMLLSSSIDRVRTATAAKIEITGERDEDTASFLIRASGVGASPLESPDRNEPCRTHPALSAAQRMVERLGGRLSAESFPDNEVLLRIRLPG